MKRGSLLLIFFLVISLLSAGCGNDESAENVVNPSDVITPRPEFPRPDFERSDWINLNGRWYFSFDPMNVGLKEKWYSNLENISGSIVVPFPWQSSLSGLGTIPTDLDFYPIPLVPREEEHKIGWYRRSFLTPQWVADRYRVFLIFGAVDWHADVWVNGRYVGSHDGGYSPFEFDITDWLAPVGFRNSLVVRVYDPGISDRELIPVGKQGDLWYSPVSGIWQTVFLEKRGNVYFEDYRVHTNLDNGVVLIDGRVRNDEGPGFYNFCLRVYDSGGEITSLCRNVYLYEGENSVPFSFTIYPFQPWSPDDPHLYNFQWKISRNDRVEDEFTGYFAMRSVEIRWAPGHSPLETDDVEDQYKYVYLNGKPVYIRGVLDQGYNPWGLYTYPSAETIEEEYRYLKSLGFNTVRIHIKGPDPYKLYLADKLGLMVIYDMPSLKMFGNGEDPIGQANFLKTVRELMERDINHPSILWWVMFNEDWGLLTPSRVRDNEALQNWVKEVVDFARMLDPSRPIEDNSAGGLGAYDHMYTDIQSWHFYYRRYDQVKDHLSWIVDSTYPGSGEIWIPGYIQSGQPLINSEFNGVDVYSGNVDVSWFLHWQVNLMRLFPKIQGYVFTELTDVEFEHNGLLKYDRTVKSLGYEEFGSDPGLLNSPDYVAVDYPPVFQAQPGEVLDIPVYFSSYTGREETYYLDYRLVGWSGVGNKIITGFSAPLSFRTYPYGVTFVCRLPVKLPDFEFAGAILFRVMDSRGNLITTNFINVYIPATPNGMVLDVDPAKFSDASWKDGFTGEEDFFYGKGEGCVSYHLPVTALSSLSKITLLMELSSGGMGMANRQTSGEMIWSDVHLYLNETEVASDVVGEYADSRGFLSYLNNPRLHGSYGKFIRADITDPSIIDSVARNRAMDLRLCSENNGLKIFGRSLGEYPWGIRVILE